MLRFPPPSEHVCWFISGQHLWLRFWLRIWSWSRALRCGCSLLLGDGLNEETKCHCVLYLWPINYLYLSVSAFSSHSAGMDASSKGFISSAHITEHFNPFNGKFSSPVCPQVVCYQVQRLFGEDSPHRVCNASSGQCLPPQLLLLLRLRAPALQGRRVCSQRRSAAVQERLWEGEGAAQHS